MAKMKPRKYNIPGDEDFDDESLRYILGVGQHQMYRENIKKPKIVRVEGFVRKKKKGVAKG